MTEAFRKAVEQEFPGGFMVREEANAIIACAIRNGPTELRVSRRTASTNRD